MASPSDNAPVVTIRRLAPSDSISELTQLLHRAYAKQVAMGLRPLAGRQDDATTKRRVFNGECHVAVRHDPGPDGRVKQVLVGSILFHEVEEAQGPPYFSKGGVASFSQFAVDPAAQGQGIGLRLLEVIEQRAREAGATELACTMAEPDTDLLNFYFRRGYRLIGHWQWPYTNYRSAILSKTLN
ncbi:MAG: GNAT family N-acetyltransferase [Planctomycetes bacterium]|nr:GNAT family N-acetyltransferase [Planctomycetota bacterium]